MKIFCYLITIFLMICCSAPHKQNLTNNMDKQETEILYQAKPFTTGGEFTAGIEGPAVDAAGNLYVVNVFKEGTIGKVTPQGEVSLFVALPVGSTGNGIRFNSDGYMLIADYTGHNVLQVDMNSLEISVYAHHPELNQPNDIAIMDNDIVFASDPSWKNGTGNLWRVDIPGNFVLMESDMGTTNGIEVSPDNKTLYVNESVQRNVWAYDLSATGEISNKRLLIQFEDFGMDGMRCDTAGNLYITRHGKGTVAKVSPQGVLLEEITLSGSKPSNIAFGGRDGRTAYVTLQDNGNIDTFRVEMPGRAFRSKG
jgi:gluconolactonase